ncbi:sulfatase-like hydrolase/transferase [Fuerstiella marisgermanici]|uniref:Arylsulfatase n=1 Tax=Fuerstiella marisgermanici TaxID=1891926 RepID=A0A1P8WLJ0_9PLAN|nr:sulfatase-like hydrolase/transferase [Fuerstiella marisgermanici]APZ94914.1 Arylsulfatase [Fuerstiella marisgermanici]
MKQSIYYLFTALIISATTADDASKPPLKPHPDAVGNTHSPGEVDNPALVPFVVRDKHKLPGIVVDETEARLVGTWQYSTHTPPYVGLGYLHDQKSGKGERSVTFTPDLPAAGMYEVRMSHCYNVRRSTNTPVTIHHADGEKTIRINQQDIPEHNKLFRTLGTFRFEAGKAGWVRIANDGTDGKYVIADAVQFLPVKDSATAAKRNAINGADKSRAVEPIPTKLNQKQRHPNIIYILADDLGYGDVSCYNPESKINTPHVDRLAAEGMRFTDAHTPSAVCTPTRYGILTGRYCWRTRLKYRVLDGLDPPLIEPDRMTVPRLLQQHGYATGCVGKWHLGMQWTDKNGQPVPAVPVDRKSRPRAGANVDYAVPFTGGPTAVGFDWYFGISASLNMSPFCYLQNDHPVRFPVFHQQRIATEFVSVDEGVRSPDFTIAGVMPRLAGEAVGYIERQAADPNQPFFLYAPLTSPHLPLAPNEEYRGTSKAGHYGDFVVETDAYVGAILEALDRTDQADNTIVVFTSDNGGLYHYWEPQEADDVKNYKLRSRGAYVKQFGHQGNAHLRGTKADIWEGGHRVPFVVRWPGKTPSGTVSDELIELTDLLATCAALVDTDLPAGAGPDSRNALTALLAAKPKERVRDYAVHHSLWGKFAIRKGDWKLIPERGSGGFTFPKDIDVTKAGGPNGQLYNLAHDPSETKNVWEDNPDVVAELSDLLTQIQKAGW